MAFSHINLDAPGIPPGREDPCPCGSGKKTRRCCGVDRSRFLPLRGRHCGVVPVDLAERVDEMAGDFTVRFLARTFLPARLGGLSPAALTDAERGELRELFSDQREQLDQALEILERVGYGRPRGRRPRTERAYGQRRGKRLEGLVGKLPRALAKRLPSSADTHRRGPNDGQDIYGAVSCSRTLRSGHLGILAAAGGLWHSRNPAAAPYAETTAGELAELITGRRRLGGKDIGEIHRLLAELEQLELSATVNRPPDGTKPNLALAIPGSPVERVERRLPDGRWVDAHAYQDALTKLSDEDALTTAQADADGPGGAFTIRIYLAGWVREQIAHGEVVTRRLSRVGAPAALGTAAVRVAAGNAPRQLRRRDRVLPRRAAALHPRPARPPASRGRVRSRRPEPALLRRPALLPRAEVEHPRPLRERQHPGVQDQPPSLRFRSHTSGLCNAAKCPAERPAALRGLTLREGRDQIELVRQALQEAAKPAQTIEYEHHRSLRPLNPAAALRAGP